MAKPEPFPDFECARVIVTVVCPLCQGEGSRLTQGMVNLPRESGVSVIAFDGCARCKKTGRLQLEIPLEQFRNLLTPPPSSDGE